MNSQKRLKESMALRILPRDVDPISLAKTGIPSGANHKKWKNKRMALAVLQLSLNSRHKSENVWENSINFFEKNREQFIIAGKFIEKFNKQAGIVFKVSIPCK